MKGQYDLIFISDCLRADEPDKDGGAASGRQAPQDIVPRPPRAARAGSAIGLDTSAARPSASPRLQRQDAEGKGGFGGTGGCFREALEDSGKCISQEPRGPPTHLPRPEPSLLEVETGLKRRELPQLRKLPRAPAWHAQPSPKPSPWAILLLGLGTLMTILDSSVVPPPDLLLPLQEAPQSLELTLTPSPALHLDLSAATPAFVTVLMCSGGFLGSLIFTSHAGSYIMSLFDDRLVPFTLIVLVAFQNVALAWLSGARRQRAGAPHARGFPSSARAQQDLAASERTENRPPKSSEPGSKTALPAERPGLGRLPQRPHLSANPSAATSPRWHPKDHTASDPSEKPLAPSNPLQNPKRQGTPRETVNLIQKAQPAPDQEAEAELHPEEVGPALEGDQSSSGPPACPYVPGVSAVPEVRQHSRSKAPELGLRNHSQPGPEQGDAGRKAEICSVAGDTAHVPKSGISVHLATEITGPAGKEGEGRVEILPLTTRSWPWEEMDSSGAASSPGMTPVLLSGPLGAGTGEFRRRNRLGHSQSCTQGLLSPCAEGAARWLEGDGLVALSKPQPSPLPWRQTVLGKPQTPQQTGHWTAGAAPPAASRLGLG
ncbi:uncharacterized protein LOC115279848 [Suricata suricatta]|uniref:uncharacterized protein LOC115279848 n=1 Tax=Suricata suricatta TaxID=37032 RepID=UPI001155ED09|nr:uncharacterized protein LOC115279848 [Suricata suricatta]